MKILGNIIWLFFGGIIGCVLWFIAGILLAVTIIGLPFAKQCFKISGFVLWPFGRNVVAGNFGVMGLFGNILWVLVFGIELCIVHLIMGLLFCLTIIGIPFGKQHFKLAMLSLAPFGSKIY